MASPELTNEENANLRRLAQNAIPGVFRSRNALAKALGIEGSSITAFFQGGGMSKKNARKLAELLGVAYEDALGNGPQKIAPVRYLPPAPATTSGADSGLTPPASGGPTFRPTSRALSIAKKFLMAPPQKFSAEIIDFAAEEVCLATAQDADRPSVVAEAIRLIILGSAAHFPLAPQSEQPSTHPPAGTRRSKIRGR